LRYLFDTHLLIWALRTPEKLSKRASAMLEDNALERSYSLVSVWEIVVKAALEKPDFMIDAQLFRSELLNGAFNEIEIAVSHVFALRELPRLHRDPFDRMLVAQAIAEDLTLVTADKQLAAYPARVIVV
jgi:PIN domain nuclease of toxin-antitoxin system